MTGLFLRFLRFGFLAWGGPVAQIAMLRRELVEEEQWVTGERFNRLLAVYQVLPGPEATELAVHLGWVRGGRIGGLLAGLGFTLPGFVLMLGVAALYGSINLRDPGIAAVLLGMQVAVIALISVAVPRIGRHVLGRPEAWVIAGIAALGTLVGLSFWITLGVAGLASMAAARMRGRVFGVLAAVAAMAILAWWIVAAGFPALPGFPATMPAGASPSEPRQPSSETGASLAELLLAGLKAGLLTFGGAYTAIPILRAEAVGRGWLSDGQFLDGLALGGILPAPLIIFGTFVGFLAGGPLGAVVVTVGIFLPAFAFSIVFGDQIEAVLDNVALHRFLEGVAAGVVGLIAVTALELAVAVAARLPSLLAGAVIFAVALLVLLRARSRLAVPLVIAGAALAGLFVLR